MDTEDDYLVPLQDQRVFGAGIKRKRIAFISAGDPPSSPPRPTASSSNVAERYLSIVLKAATPVSAEELTSNKEAVTQTLSTAESQVCEVCHLPLSSAAEKSATNSWEIHTHQINSRPHEATLPHQVSLPHSHPPSHLSRSHPGLRYLSSYGWDPDSRLGLGATGEGIRVPIKGKVKNDTVGLGVETKLQKKKASKGRLEEPKVEKFHAGEVRKRELRSKRNGDRLRQIFYEREDVERLLGGAG